MTTLLFPSIEFPGRNTLAGYEVADRLRVTRKHVANLFRQGAFGDLKVRGNGIHREHYDQFVLRNLTISKVMLPPEALDPRRFPFPLSDLTGHAVFLVEEVASALRVTTRHLALLITEGSLVALNVGSCDASSYRFRIPGEAYRAFLLSRIVQSHPRNRLKPALSGA